MVQEEQKQPQQPKKDRSVRRTMSRDLTMGLVGVVVVISIAAMLLNYLFLTRRATVQLETTANDYLSYLRDSLEVPIWNLDEETVTKIGESYINNELVAKLRILESTNNVLYKGEKPYSKGLGSDIIEKSTQVIRNGQIIGHIEIALTSKVSDENNKQMLWGSISTMLVIVLALGIMSRFLLRAFVRKPLDQLIQGMDRIAEGDYDYRFPEAAQMEIRTITSRFQSMMEQVREREASFAEVNQKLEQEISRQQRAEKRSLESEQRVRMLLESANEGFLEIDREALIKDVNQEMCTIFGRLREELADRTLFDMVNPKNANILLKQLARANRGVKSSYEISFNRPDGKRVDCLVNSTPLFDIKGVSGSFSMVTDITQRKAAEEKVRRLNLELENRVIERTKQLELANQALQESLASLQRAQRQLVQSEKMAALGDLVAGVAHEINTPVGIGVTAASFLEEKTEEFGKLHEEKRIRPSDLDKYMATASEATTTILTNLKRAADLIRSFKQVAADQSSEERRPFRLKSYIDEVLLSLRPKYKRTAHTINVSCPEDLEVDSYPGAFSQIITNLVVNSITHGFDGVERGHIRIDVSVYRNSLLLRYMDTGKGMDAETLKNLYDPFFTTKRTVGGTGLGMHIVYNLVTQTMGGKIACGSTPKNGTVFTITIPIKARGKK